MRDDDGGWLVADCEINPLSPGLTAAVVKLSPSPLQPICLVPCCVLKPSTRGHVDSRDDHEPPLTNDDVLSHKRVIAVVDAKTDGQASAATSKNRPVTVLNEGIRVMSCFSI